MKIGEVMGKSPKKKRKKCGADDPPNFDSQEMMEKFKKYDVDGDGKISKKELVTWVFGPNGADEKAR